MVVAGGVEVCDDSNYDRKRELKAFDDSKAGVKGLVDAGVTKVPRMFIRPPDNLRDASDTKKIQFSIPVIDLEGIENNPVRRKEIIDEVRHASETWGFFQVVNHGIPSSILEEMKDGVQRFFEQDIEVKKEFYARDRVRRYRYTSNFDLYTSPFANWRDTCFCVMAPDPPKPEELPAVLRVQILGSCFCQLITNDKFKSVEHRVLANREGPRISVACFFTTGLLPSSRLYGPIEELLLENNPPIYRETTVRDFVSYIYEHGLDGTSPLHLFRL
ncbi:hypothetical protein POUND7_019139 [Theobroma cacao]